MNAQTGNQQNNLSSNPSPWVVMKFGGTSVASVESWQVIAALLRQRLAEGLRPVIVHSAIGGTSNQLEALLELATSGEHEALLAELRARYRRLAEDLDLNADELIGEYLEELEQLVAGIRLVREVSHRVHVKIMSLGELMTTRLGAAYLQSQGLPVGWVDARDVLVSVESPNLAERAGFLSATCSYDPQVALQADFTGRAEVVLTQGFIASNPRGEGVLLGRGGSDTSAAYFAAKLQAQRLEIWTDVPGMFSADPRMVSGARLLKTLRYEEAQEIASTGGSVLHPRCISPVRRYDIPLWIKCTARPDSEGTLISRDSGDDSPRVKAISRREGITLVSMETLGMWQQVGFLADAFKVFSDLGLSIDLVSTSESNVTVTLDPNANSMDQAMLQRLQSRLEHLCRVRVITNVAVVSLVGQKIRALLHEIGPTLELFEENKIHLLSQAASDLNLSFVVDEEQSLRLVKGFHATLVQAASNDKVFGETWEEIQEDPAAENTVPEATPSWWMQKREALISLAQEHCSAYVYDRESIQQACANLLGLQSVDRVFYAIKANSNPEVLRIVHQSGLNFECVSPGEIQRILELFPDIDPQRILFTPNFAPREDYAFGLEQGVRVTLDNLHPLRHWAELFAGKELILRLDPGQGRGHHEHVRTAGVHSKFGIPMFELDEARSLVESAGATVVGLHAHTGSGILQADNWHFVARQLVEALEVFASVKFLDLGGGLGIPEKPGQVALDMNAVSESLDAIKAEFPQLELWMEPGRYVVANSGVLLTTVTQTKGKGEVRY
ncbi:MAG: bifunctional aspartate kinase/diaminopimelate decarboxylase, partial [Gammaproteobacteria bacterium]|nr:bifunctional aspartate kinase/diaminopimelate decarboxylase [Gammaproteobacteria bacterium]